MILTFLPFHETNIFGRLLSIIEYNFATSKDWAFLEEFGKKEYPVPFSAVSSNRSDRLIRLDLLPLQIVKHTASSTHSLITRITDHLNRGIQVRFLSFHTVFRWLSTRRKAKYLFTACRRRIPWKAVPYLLHFLREAPYCAATGLHKSRWYASGKDYSSYRNWAQVSFILLK